MVTTLVKLRFLLLFNTIKKSPWQIVGVALGALYGLGVMLAIIAGLVALSFAPIELARTITVLAGAGLVIGWMFLPLVTAGIDQTIDPSRLATFPIPIRTLLLALAISGVFGVPGIVTSIAALATAATWWQHPLAALAAVVCAAIGVLTCVVGSRMLAALSSRISTGRRFREARNVLLIVPLVLLGPILIGAGQLIRDFSDVLPRIAAAVSFTPFGAIWAVPGDVASGNLARAGLEFLIGLVTLLVFVAVWRWGLARALELPAHANPVKAGRRGIGFFGMFPGSPTGAVAARALTYWIRDPRYSQQLLTVPLIPALVFFYAGASNSFGALNAVGPVVALLLGMSTYTDISYDNTAFATHLQTGVRGRADRLGRIIAVAVFALPISVALVVGSVSISDAWALLPGLLGITIGVLFSGFAVSSITSARFTFEVPAPGDSPFKAKPGGSFTLLLSTLASWTVLGALVLPEFILAVVGFATGQPVYGWMALVVGIALGTGLLVLGVRLGGTILDQRGPELLAQLQRQK